MEEWTPHLVVLAGDGQGDLPFEIEVVLAADAQAAFDPVRGGGDGGRGLAAPELVGRLHLGPGGEALVHGDGGGDGHRPSMRARRAARRAASRVSATTANTTCP